MKNVPILVFVITWSVVGYPFIAVTANSLGMQATYFSLLFRIFAAGGALLIILLTIRFPTRLIVKIYLLFWTLYFFRLFSSSIIGNEQLTQETSFYWMWGFGSCFLPAFSALLNKDIETLDRLHIWLMRISLTASVIAFMFASTSFQTETGEVREIYRLNTTSLNAISMGQLGVTTLLLGICNFIPKTTGRKSNTHKRRQWMSIILIVFGGAVMIMANSRGPLVAFAGCIAFVVMAGARRKRTYIFGGIAIVVTIIVGINQASAFLAEGGIIERFSGTFDANSLSGIGRLIAFSGAWEQFLSSPLYGDAIEENVTKFYPHNVILEALMATGLLGGIPFIVMMGWAIKRSWQLVRSGSRYLWVGVLAVQYIIGSMFSGAIYGTGAMWVLMAFMLCPSLTEVLKKPSRKSFKNAVVMA